MLKLKIYYKKNIYVIKKLITNVYINIRKMVVHNWPEKISSNKLYV